MSLNPLDALKQRLNDGQLVIQQEEGAVLNTSFSFNPPATESELSKLPDFAPRALREFLVQHNGATLFKYKEGDSTTLFSIEEMEEYKKLWDCPDNFIPVGIGMDGIEIVCECDLESGTNKMWIGEALNYEDDELVKFPFGFASFLDYFIVAQGTSFWEWFVREGE